MRFGNVFRGQNVVDVTVSVTFFGCSRVCYPLAVHHELIEETSAIGPMEVISVAEVKHDRRSRIKRAKNSDLEDRKEK